MINKARILIAEDEEITRENLQHALSRDGYEIEAVEDGESAVESLQQRSFDVVLTDLRMHEVDGVEVLKSAKSLQPESEVIVLTG